MGNQVHHDAHNSHNAQSGYSPSPEPSNSDIENEQEDIAPKVLAMHQQLINMGFPEELSLAAASKHPSNIEDAMDWLMNKQTIDQLVQQEHIDIDEQRNQMQQSQPQKHSQKPQKQLQKPQKHATPTLTPANDTDHKNDKLIHEGVHNDRNHNHNHNESGSGCQMQPEAKNNHAIEDAISTADIVVKGEFDPNVSEQSISMLLDLLCNAMQVHPQNESARVTKQIRRFMRWSHDIKEVKLNSMFYEEICACLLVEHKRVTNLYAFDQINQLFQNIESITAYHTGWISKFYLELLLEMLERIHFLEYSKLQTIHINDINNMRSVDKDIEKYNEIYKRKNWQITKGMSNLTITRYLGSH